MTSNYDKLKREVAWRLSKKIKTLGGIDTEDLSELVCHLDHMIDVNKKMLSAIEQIADNSSPYDKTGEPLQVRIAKDLTRRIQIAKDAL